MCVQCPETLALIKHTHSLLQTFPGCLWEEIWSQRVGLPPGSPLTLSSWSACHASHTHTLVQLGVGSPGCCWAPQHGPSAADGGTTGFSDTLRLAGVPVLKPEMVFDTEAVGQKVGWAGEQPVNYVMTCGEDGGCCNTIPDLPLGRFQRGNPRAEHHFTALAQCHHSAKPRQNVPTFLSFFSQHKRLMKK